MNTATIETRSTGGFRSLLRRLAPGTKARIAAPPRHVGPPPPVTQLGKKVLIVDDDAVIRKTTTTKLQSQGYTVLNATDASSAISAARKEQPDLILLDLNFPPDVGGVAWDGFLIMNWLRRLEEARDIPVIIMTGSDPATCWQRSFAAGAVGFLPKPLETENLLAAVNHHTQKARAGQPKRPVTADFQI